MGSLVEATENLIKQHNPKWGGHGWHGIHTKWFADLRSAGFVGIESFSFDVEVPYTREAWRGRIRACRGIGATLSDIFIRSQETNQPTAAIANEMAIEFIAQHATNNVD